MNYFCPKSNFALELQDMHPQKMEKIHGCALRVWDPRTNTKLGFLAHLADIEGTGVRPKSGRGAREFRKIQKKWKNTAWSHGVSCSTWEKLPNMAWKGFTGVLFHKEVLPGRNSLGLLAR
jgi:hypothetical protein